MKLLQDYILLEEIKEEATEEVTPGGVVIPPDFAEKNKNKPDIGVVIDISPEVKSVHIGNKVLFKRYGVEKIRIDNKECLLADESDIIAIL